MSELYKKKCIACDGSTLPFDLTEIHKYLKKVDGWHVKCDDKKNYFLIKEFKFRNFLESQNFVNSVGMIAEKEGHHPDISITILLKIGNIFFSHFFIFLSHNSK